MIDLVPFFFPALSFPSGEVGCEVVEELPDVLRTFTTAAVSVSDDEQESDVGVDFNCKAFHSVCTAINIYFKGKLKIFLNK